MLVKVVSHKGPQSLVAFLSCEQQFLGSITYSNKNSTHAAWRGTARRGPNPVPGVWMILFVQSTALAYPSALPHLLCRRTCSYVPLFGDYLSSYSSQPIENFRLGKGTVYDEGGGEGLSGARIRCGYGTVGCNKFGQVLK
jgi:hypothetical protein